MAVRSEGFDCQTQHAEELLQSVPDISELDDDELLTRLLPSVCIDWRKTEGPSDVLLKKLVEQEINAKAAKSESKLRRVHQLMISATMGLDEHPEWYESACYCSECRSNC